MPHYQSRGSIPKKRFTNHPKPDGGICYEHLFSTEQMLPESSIAYRLYAPSRVARVEPMAPVVLETPARPIGQLLLFRPDLIESQGDFLEARAPVMFSGEEFVISIARPTAPMTRFYCNIYADELVLVVKGSGVLESVLGDIRYTERDLVHVPRGMVVRWVSDPVPHEMAVWESRAPIRPPKGFMKPNGQFSDAASYHERDLKTPVWRAPIDELGEFPVVVKTGNELATTWWDHHPFDVVGWDGCYYPFALNMADYEPLTGRIFLLVDRFQVFATEETGFVAVTPRRLPDIPNASPANPFHSNIVCDEMMYRFGGAGISGETATGTMSLTPRGLGHGPKPGFETVTGRTHQTMWALLMETRLTLTPSVQAMASADQAYARALLGDGSAATKGAPEKADAGA
ncbi:MAG: hypothetical protein JWO33_96 [Caulobacteraceae bacterium]|nr:hypothetical protein [Caulobacteraceae bacterium]